MSYWNIVLKNKKEYLIQTNIQNVAEFTKFCTLPNTWNDFSLVNTKVINGFKIDTVIIFSEEIVSIEYCTNYNK